MHDVRRGQVRDLHVHCHGRPCLWRLQCRVLLLGRAKSTNSVHDVHSRPVSEDRVPGDGQPRVQHVLARVHVPRCGIDGPAGVRFRDVCARRWDVCVSDVLSRCLCPGELRGAL